MTEAVKQKDQDTATTEKARIEDRQREEAAKRMNEGVDWHPQLFRRVQGGQGGIDEGEEDLDWIINAKVLVLPLLFAAHSADTDLVMAKHPKSRSNRFLTSQLFFLVKHLTVNLASLPYLEPTPMTQTQQAVTAFSKANL